MKNDHMTGVGGALRYVMKWSYLESSVRQQYISLTINNKEQMMTPSTIVDDMEIHFPYLFITHGTTCTTP